MNGADSRRRNAAHIRTGRVRLWIAGVLAPLAAMLAIGVLAPSSALAANGTISGTVTDQSTGNGIPGLTVALERTTQGNVVTTAVTDADGHYTLSPALGQTDYVVEFNQGADPDWNDLFYDGQTTFANANTAGNQVNDTAGNVGGIDGVLTNNPGSLTGTVTDASDSQPIKGVDVVVTDSHGSTLGTATTAANGVYTLASVPSGTDTITFNETGAVDFNSTSVTQTVAPGPTTTLDRALAPQSAHITGTVTAQGAPVAGEQVVLLDSDGTSTQNTVATDSDGLYTFTHVTPGAHVVRFEPAAGQNLVPQYFNGKFGYSSADPVTVTTNTTTPNINASLTQGATITGTVTDQQTGAGVGNVELNVLGCDTSNCSIATNNAGQYTLTGLPTGTYYIEAFTSNGNYLYPQYFTSQGPQGSPNGISVTAGQTTTVNDPLLVGGKITGRLTDSSGNPIAGESVDAVAASGQQFQDPVTGADGTYTITGLPTGSYKLEFYGNSAYVSEYLGGTASSATATSVSVTQGQTTANVNASIPPASAGGRIAGTVSGPGGLLTGAFVTLYDSGGHRLDLPGSGLTTDQDGTYRTPALLPGSYRVKFTSSSGNLGFQYYNLQTSLAAANAVSVSAGATTAGINGSLSAGGSIGGTVTDATSHIPVTGVTVQLLNAGGEVLGQTSTAQDGSYTLSGIPAGTAYHVEFDPRGVAIQGGDGILYAPQFWNNKTTLAGSDAVAVATGAKTPNVNAALGAASSVPAVVPPTPTPKPTPAPKPGKPTTSKAKLSGLGKGKPSLTFSLAAGKNAPKLKSFTVKLPKGLSFIKKGLKKGLKVSGGGKFSDKLSKGALVVTLKGTASKVSVSLGSKALAVSKSLKTSAKKKKVKSLTVSVSTVDAKKGKATVKLTFKKPS